MKAMRKMFASALMMALICGQVPMSLSAANAGRNSGEIPRFARNDESRREILRFAQIDSEVQEGSKKSVQAVPYFSEPAIAPDRAEIAFVSGGDIWTAPLAGGEAHLLIANAAYDSRPRYSPDGKRLAFLSTRTGGVDIYVYTFATGETRRMTFEDGAEWLDGWSRDGRWLYFSSSSYDIAGMNDVFRVSS